jgi:serine/threonine-protein kinase HipA
MCSRSGAGGAVHLKNLALLTRRRGEPRLSPGYDLVNTAVVIPDDPFALPVDGQQRNLGPASWVRFAEYCELPIKAIRQVARSFLAREAEAGELIERSSLTPPRREQYRAVMNSRRDAVAGLAIS